MAHGESSSDNGRKNQTYAPGMYGRQRPGIQGVVERAFQDWQKTRGLPVPENKKYPIICFSRTIGVGALEIADMLAEQIGYRVIDREIMEYLASRKGVDPLFAAMLEEHGGEMEDLFAILFGVKMYAKSEYSRLLFRAIFSFAALGPAIFVGRGAHLILPRERVLAVRLICSDHFRAARVAAMLNMSEAETLSRLRQLDEDQKLFFQNIYGITEDSEDCLAGYDIVINRDFFESPGQVAEIVKTAFVQKFGQEWAERRSVE